MKKIIAYLLVTIMCISCLAACGSKENENTDAKAAIDYVYAMYKDAGTVTAMDFERTAQVMIGGKPYAVEWTVDNEAVKVTVVDKVAKIDVDEKSTEEVAYTLTATVTDADGNKASREFKYTVPKFEGYEKIVEDAYKLEAGAAMEGTFTLEGVILSVDTPYDEGYKNVTVTIQIGDMADKPIMCYRLKDGDGVTAASTLKIGDTITVTGTLKNYNGTIEFDAGCTLDKVVVGTAEAPEVPTVPAGATMEEIVDIAYTLISGQALETSQTLTGVITSVDTPYDEGYQNVTVTIQVGDKADKLIKCFRMKGDGADKVAVGDTITVTGTLKNYSGTIEFDAGCTLDSYTTGGSSETPSESTKPSESESTKPSEKPSESTKPSESQSTKPNGSTNDNPKDEPVAKPSTPEEIVKAAYALKDGGELDGTYTLTGVITKVDTAYSAQYKNVTVTIQVGNMKDKLIKCYRMAGTGADVIGVGDTITVTGTLINYEGTVQFDAKCSLDSYKQLDNNAPTDKSPEGIVNAAYALEEGETLDGTYTLTGVITMIKEAYDKEYQNVTVVMQIGNMEDKQITCYRLKGDGADLLAAGDTITVTGTIKNHYGLVEFATCTLDKYVLGERSEELTTPEQIVKAAYALEGGKSLDRAYTLTGKITDITEISTSYKNATVTIVVDGLEDYPILCYRLKGTGYDTLEVGDTITVTGILINYVSSEGESTIEFTSGCKLDAVK